MKKIENILEISAGLDIDANIVDYGFNLDALSIECSLLSIDTLRSKRFIDEELVDQFIDDNICENAPNYDFFVVIDEKNQTYKIYREAFYP